MSFKKVKILGVRYNINPSMANLCGIEEDTGYNLVLGVPIRLQNLRFMKAVITNVIETERGEHLSEKTLEALWSADVCETQAVFEKVMTEMYATPSRKETAPKNPIARVIRKLKT